MHRAHPATPRIFLVLRHLVMFGICVLTLQACGTAVLTRQETLPSGAIETRYATLTIPDGYSAGLTYPLIITLHGLGQTDADALDNWRISARNSVGESECSDYTRSKAAFFLAPRGVLVGNGLAGTTKGQRCSVVGLGCNTGWSVPDPDNDASWADPNSYVDVTFITNLIDQVIAYYPTIDRTRVYVQGFSNGAALAEVLLCGRSTSFAGFGINAIGMPGNVINHCGTPSEMAGLTAAVPYPGTPRGVPVIYTQGLLDSTLTDPNAISNFEAFFTTRNDLSNPVVATTPYNDFYPDNTTTELRELTGTGAPVNVYEIADFGHGVPYYRSSNPQALPMAYLLCTPNTTCYSAQDYSMANIFFAF
jgi:poly(3-hydroxybutyrate) depolymerase